MVVVVLQLAQIVPSRLEVVYKKKQNVLKNFVTKLVKLMTYQLALGLDERPVGAIHFVVKSTGIAQIMAVAISSP